LRLTDNLSKQRRIIRELNIINELSASLLSNLDMDYVIEILLDRSKELLMATRSAVVLLDKKGKIQNFYSSMGPISNCKIRLTGILEKVYKDMIL
jgi:predicted oxidoreductase